MWTATIGALWLAGLFPNDGEAPDYQKPESATAPQYFELLEKNTHIIYPVLAVVVLMLMVGGLVQAWRSQDLDGQQKAEFKRLIVLELRRDTFGCSVEDMARNLKLESFKLVKLLEEMQRDGLVSSVTNTQRLTTWRLNGVEYVSGPGLSRNRA